MPNTTTSGYNPPHGARPAQKSEINYARPGVGLEVSRKDTCEAAGHLHLFCKDAWAKKNNADRFTFEPF